MAAEVHRDDVAGRRDAGARPAVQAQAVVDEAVDEQTTARAAPAPAPVEEVDPVAARPRRRSRPARRESGGGSGSIAPRIAGAMAKAPPRVARTPPVPRPPPSVRGARRAGALDAIPSRSRSASTRSRSSSPTSRRPTSAARTTSDPDDDLYGLYEGVPRTEYGRRLGRGAEPDHARSACRSRKTSPTRTTSPTRSGSPSSTSSPTTSASTTTGSGELGVTNGSARRRASCQRDRAGPAIARNARRDEADHRQQSGREAR